MDIDKESGKEFLRRNSDVADQLHRDLFVALVGSQLSAVTERFIFEPLDSRTMDRIGLAFSELLGRLHRQHEVESYRVEQDADHGIVTVDVRLRASPSCVRIVYQP